MNSNFRNFALWVVIFLLVLALVTLFQSPGHRGGGGDIAYSQLLSEADAGRISNVVISGPEISGTYTDGRTFTTYAPNDPMLVSKLQQKGVQITAKPLSDSTPWFIVLLGNILPFALFFGAFGPSSGLMIFCAKNANTTTMRIGKSADLKKRLNVYGPPTG